MTDYKNKKLRQRCFFDIKIGENDAGRVIFELFNDICPLTCENFKALCTGERGIGKMTGKPLHYKDVVFHRVVKNFMIQGGDFSMGNGRGGESIYGGTFKDENFEMKHDQPFLLSMANRGKDTNGAQFFITTVPTPHLNGVHVVFGHVITGQEIIKEIENQPTDKNSRPLVDVKIANCGELIPQIKPKDKKEKKKKKRKHKKSDKESGEESSSDEDDHKKKKKRKKHKKNKDKSKESDSEKKEQEEDIERGQFYSTIRPEEIPEIPSNKFLMRKTDIDDQTTNRNSTQNQENQKADRHYRRYQRDDRISRSGRKIKGRGAVRYRTPTPERRRSGSETPPHWRNAQSKLKTLKEVTKQRKQTLS